MNMYQSVKKSLRQLDHKLLFVAAIVLPINGLTAATVSWIGGDGTWQTPANWSGGAVPAAADDVTINNGAKVTYVPGGDFSRTGGVLTIDNGSTWEQTTTHWSAFNNGGLVISGGSTFSRTTTGHVRFSTSINSNTYLTMTDSTFTVGEGLRLSQANQTMTQVSLVNSRITLGHELWFGINTIGGVNQQASLSLQNSTITATAGAVGIWFWSALDGGNDFSVNVIGAGSRVEGRVGIRLDNSSGIVTGGVASTTHNATVSNTITWEDLWSEGILLFNGQSWDEVDGDFSDYFRTEGTAGTTSYVLLSIPEPAQSVMLGFAGLILCARRRRA